MQPSDAFKLRKAFFHALGKANTEATQEVYESAYKSLGNITVNDVWIDSIPYCATQTDADNFASTHPEIIKKYDKFALTEVPGSNGQAWYCDDGGTWMRPWISPVDIPHPTTNLPSTGFQVILYDESENYIAPTVGIWIPDYYAGMIYFQEGYTPAEQGWGNIKATFYVYIGKTLYDTSIISGVKLNTYKVTNPYQVGESIDITNGNGSNSGTSDIIRTDNIILPIDETTFNNDNSISIWINGEKLEKTTEVNYIDSTHISFNIPLDVDDIFEIQKT